MYFSLNKNLLRLNLTADYILYKYLSLLIKEYNLINFTKYMNLVKIVITY